jgi:hypothetical protein
MLGRGPGASLIATCELRVKDGRVPRDIGLYTNTLKHIHVWTVEKLVFLHSNLIMWQINLMESHE